MRRIEIPAGAVFDRWTVIGEAPSGPDGGARYVCQCACGAMRDVSSVSLRNGCTRQCTQCARRQPNIGQRQVTHGKSHSRAYSSWTHMHDRCRNTNHRFWRRYGGRGIRVCARWNLFEAFYLDMGDPPPKQSLDRIDNNGNYEPDNCRWATHSQQMRNRQPRKDWVAA